MATIQLKKLGAATYTTIDLQKFFKALGNFGQDGNYLKIDNSVYDIKQIKHEGGPRTETIQLTVTDINGNDGIVFYIEAVMDSIRKSGYNGIQKIEGVGYVKTSTFLLDSQIHN